MTDLDRIVADARVAAEALMSDRCVITRTSGEPVYDPATDTYTEPESIEVYAGPCRVRVGQLAADRQPVAGDGKFVLTATGVSIPAHVTGVEKGDYLTVAEARYVPSLVGVRLRVVTVQRASQASAWRLTCEEVAIP